MVLDAGNYIKGKRPLLVSLDFVFSQNCSFCFTTGYRYELYCLSKEHKTTHCILEIVIHKDIIFERNSSRAAEEERYDEDILQKLMNRYESPDSRNRWDSPHIPVMNDSVDMDLIRAALYDRNAPPPNLSTQSQPVSGADYMTHLDSSTRQVVNHILSEQEKGCLTNIQVPGSSQPVNLSRSVSAVELNKLRRQFIAYTKSHPVNALDQISSNFVLFIGSELQT